MRNLYGNIFDEYDDEEDEYKQIDENTFLINGSVSIFDLRKILEIEIEDGDYDTLSGYLTNLLGRIPEDEENPTIETDKVIYRIEEYEDKRIKWVKACLTKQEEPNTEEGEGEREEEDKNE